MNVLSLSNFKSVYSPLDPQSPCPNIFIIIMKIYYFSSLSSIEMSSFFFSFFQVNINVEISFFEIYNEKIHDLLGSCKDKAGKKQTVSLNFTMLTHTTLVCTIDD